MTLHVPHDTWAERNLIGACTYLPVNVLVCVDAGLEPGHFYHPDHRRRYGELWDCWRANRDPDPGLTRDGTTGPAYDAPQISNPSEYVHIILDCARRRAIIDDALGKTRPFTTWAEWDVR